MCAATLLSQIKFDRTESVDFQEQMLQLGMMGLSLKECGDYFGLDEKDWQEWCKDHPITEARWACGKARGVAIAGQKLVSQVREGKLNAITFYLKTLGGFSEKSTMQIESEVRLKNIPIPPVPTNPIEAAKVYRDFIKNS